MLTANPGSGDTDALQAWHARGPDELSHDEKEAAESEVARPDDRSGHGLVTWTGGDGFIVFFLIPYTQSTERGREQQKHIVCLVREPRAWAPKRDQRARIHWYGDAGWSCMLTTSTLVRFVCTVRRGMAARDVTHSCPCRLQRQI